MKSTLRIATRASQLALWQANWVKDRLESIHPGLKVELCLIKTQGDKILDTPLAKIGGKGLFVKELEVALQQNKADLAVHSTKDVPVELPPGLELSVITKRESPFDAFVSNQYPNFEALPQGAKVGTSSLRRVAQLKAIRSDLEFVSLRGNVNTRLKKLDQGDFSAIILAAAGLIRLGMKDRIASLLSAEVCLPAIAQGAVSIETRIGDQETYAMLKPLADEETHFRILAERALLIRLNGGCQAPLAGYSEIKGDELTLTGLIADLDGKTILKQVEKGPKHDAVRLGQSLGQRLLDAGGKAILEELGIKVD